MKYEPLRPEVLQKIAEKGYASTNEARDMARELIERRSRDGKSNESSQTLLDIYMRMIP